MYTELCAGQKLIILSRSRVRRLMLKEASESDTAEVVIDAQCGFLLSGVPSVQR